MAKRRKAIKPGLTPPRWIKRKWVQGGKLHREKVFWLAGDDNKVINGRRYRYRPTKGWLSMTA